MEETISIKQIFEVLKKRMASIILLGIVGTLVAGVLAFVVLTPRYSSQAQLVVTLPQSDTTDANSVNTNLQMINTYKDIITGDLVIKEVSQKLEKNYGLKISDDILKEEISVEQNDNSQMFSIIAKSDSPREAANIANVTAETFKANAQSVLNVDRISIISDAIAESSPVFPNKKLMLAAGLVAGLMLGVFLAFVLELLDRTVKESRVLSEEFGLTVLGSIPALTKKELAEKLTPKQVKQTQKIARPIQKEIAPVVENNSGDEPRRRRNRV